MDNESNAMRVRTNNQHKQMMGVDLLVEHQDQTYLALVNTGTSATLAGLNVTLNGNKVGASKHVQLDTQAGSFITKRIYQLKGLKLPQFTPNCTITFTVHHFKKRAKYQYNIILGRDFIEKVGLNILFATKQFKRDNM